MYTHCTLIPDDDEDPYFEQEESLLIIVIASVFGFPSVIIFFICILRFRIQYLQNQDVALHRSRTFR